MSPGSAGTAQPVRSDQFSMSVTNEGVRDPPLAQATAIGLNVTLPGIHTAYSKLISVDQSRGRGDNGRGLKMYRFRLGEGVTDNHIHGHLGKSRTLIGASPI
jgi:hypothetical protein